MWQPIETAPRNQTFLAVLNCAGEQTICTMRWPVAEAKNSRPDNKPTLGKREANATPLEFRDELLRLAMMAHNTQVSRVCQ